MRLVKKPLESLIPMDELKQIVQKIARVPKEQIDKIEAERQSRKRKKD